MSAKSKRAGNSLLLTGFGPFPGFADNASARLVEALALRARTEHQSGRKDSRARQALQNTERGSAAPESPAPGVEIHAAILPTEWRRAPDLLAELIAKHRPDVTLHFGIAREAQAFRIETRAANACEQDHDAAGLRPAAARLQPEGDPFRHATIPVHDIVARLTALGYPAELSDDAGAYLCNAVLYHALDPGCDQGGRRHMRSGFIHIPADLTRPTLTFEQALEGALEIVRMCLAVPGGET